MRHARRQPPQDVQPGGLARDGYVAEMAAQGVDQRVAVAPILRSAALKMGREASRADELRQHRLLQPGRAVVEQRLGVARRLDQRRRHDHVAQPQPGPERPREPADMDRAIRRCRRQRRHGRAVMAESAGVVVFEDVAARGLRPIDQSGAARERQRRADGELVRRRDVDQRRRSARQRLGDQPGMVDRRMHEARPGGGEGVGRA